MAEEAHVEDLIHEKLKMELEVIDVAHRRSEEEVLFTTVTNLSKDLIHWTDRKFWAGNMHSERPTLRSGYYTVLTQRGTHPRGVKWGQAWANGDDATAHKWVVAFDTVNGKAYAEAGPFGPVDWNVVAVKLSSSGSKSESDDHNLGVKAVAEIKGLKAYATFR